MEQAVNRLGCIESDQQRRDFHQQGIHRLNARGQLAITAVNLTGFFHVTQAAMRQMLARGTGGHTVNITRSLVDHAERQNPSGLVSLTKGGLAAVTRSPAVEYASRGVRFNAVALGVIENPVDDPGLYEGLAQLHPLGRVGKIRDVVEGILYLEENGVQSGCPSGSVDSQSAGHQSPCESVICPTSMM